MAALITLTVEQLDRQDLDTAMSLQVDPDDIKLIVPEFFDWINDRGYVEYYDNQRKATRNLLCTQDPVTIKGLSSASFSALTFISSIDGYPVGKLGYLQVHDSSVYETANEPHTLRYNFGERNHAKHKDLLRCTYPLIISSVDISSTNSVTVPCCVANTITAGASISIVGDETHTYTVLSSTCSTDGTSTQIIVTTPLSASTDAGDTVALT